MNTEGTKVAARRDPRVGTELGPYRIEAVIGRGGMGVVYRAEDTRLDRRVALKVLTPELADDEGFRQRFLRESRLAASIDDPNIIPVYEAGETDGVFWLAMRFVDGTDLEARLRPGPLSPADAVHVLGQIASALDAAHIAGLVHRDVKPANVLIASGSAFDRPDHAYLTDFGLTKHRGSETGVTRAGSFLGTLDYIAPEQIEGRPVDGRADQYALACVAYQCLTGTVPFVRDNDAATLMAHLRDAPPAVSAVRPSLPQAADAVITRGMAKSPQDRYPSCVSLVTALRQALGVRPAEAEPSAAGPSRRRGAIAAVVLLVVAVLGAAAFIQARTFNADQSKAGAATSTRPGPTASASVAVAQEPEIDPRGLGESVLYSLIPFGRGACVRGDYAPVSSGVEGEPDAIPVASLVCATSAALVEIRQFAPPTDETDFTPDKVLVAQISAWGLDDRECSPGRTSAGPWTMDGRPAGYFWCAMGVGQREVEWSNRRSNLLVTAHGSDTEDLASWWSRYRELVGALNTPIDHSPPAKRNPLIR